MRHQLVPLFVNIKISDSPPYIFTTPSKKRALELLLRDEEPLYVGIIYCIVIIVVYSPYEASHSCDLAFEEGVHCFRTTRQRQRHHFYTSLYRHSVVIIVQSVTTLCWVATLHRLSSTTSTRLGHTRVTAPPVPGLR